MRKIRPVLRMHHEGFSKRRISQITGISRDTVTDYLTRALAAKVAWPIPEDLDDQQLENLLFPVIKRSSNEQAGYPDWQSVHEGLRAKKGATLQGLHSDYLETQPTGIGYSYFCECYRKFLGTLKRYMRRIYEPGERVLVDYAGPTIPILNVQTGETFQAQIFVAVLGASRYTYVEAHRSQSLSNWIMAHSRMLAYFNGAPKVIVCDNLKAGVTKASRTDPVVNATYQDFADHYGIVIIPTRPHKPKDKAPVENGVLVVERWILFRLRHRVFTSLAELNDAIKELLIDLNLRPFQKLIGCRKSAFESIDLPALKQLPAEDYVYAEIRYARVYLDYCVTVHGTLYSVPEYLVRQEVELRIYANTIEVVWKQKRVASHARRDHSEPVINRDHMPPAHKAFAGWESEQTLDLARRSGRHTVEFIDGLLGSIKTREQGYRLHITLQRLLSDFDSARLDTACRRAIDMGSRQINTVRSILRNKLDQVEAPNGNVSEAKFDHLNVRGAQYYN